MNRHLRATVVVATTAALVTGSAMSASADHDSTHGPGKVLASGLVGPLGLAVGSEGTVYVAEAFAGQLTAVDRSGGTEVLVGGRQEIAGVDARGKGTTVFVATNFETLEATLERVLPNGRTRVIARLDVHEAENNPDQVNTYGFTGLTPDCAAQVPDGFGGVPYPGIVEAHPYAVAIAGGGYYVADAAGNTVLSVSRSGEVRTVAVLPPQPVTITAELVETFNEMLQGELGPDAPAIPDCVAGATYAGEPVPTDVEVGPDGMLYVSTLPGFPELPGTGSVYRIDPSVAGGDPQKVFTGFTGATNLAVSPDGTVYVSELFGGQVSRATPAGPVTVAELPLPAAVEHSGGKLYVAYDVFPGEMGPDGKVAVLQP